MRFYAHTLPVMLEPAGFDNEHWTPPHSDPDLWVLQLDQCIPLQSPDAGGRVVPMPSRKG